MKSENIALFKRFLKTEGANVLFAGMYKQYHDKKYPDDVEEYLKLVDARDAILEAFHFPEGNSFGVDYWIEKAVKWEKTISSASASQFYAFCRHNVEKVEREAAKPLTRVTDYLHPKGCSKEEPEGIVKALHTPGGNSDNDSTQRLDAWIGKNFKKEEPKPEPTPRPNGVSEEQMALSGFTMFNVTKKSRRYISDDTISITNKSGHRVCFNGSVSEEIIKANHPYLHVFSKEGAIFFLIDDSPENGIKWRAAQHNVVFSHKELILNILSFFGINDDINYLTISKNMAKTGKNLFYKITKKQ